MDREELREDPRLLLESKLVADGVKGAVARSMVKNLSDEKVKEMLKPFIEKEAKDREVFLRQWR